MPDICWEQRLSNLESPFKQLDAAVKLSQSKLLTDLEKQGMIQAFEFTHELAWKVMKDYFDFQGTGELITGSRDASREAFNKGLVQNGDIWMEMIQSRNQSRHTYNKKTADEIVKKITHSYHAEIRAFILKTKKLLIDDDELIDHIERMGVGFKS